MMFKALVVLMMLLLSNASVLAEGDATFKAWLEALKAEAIEKGISEETVASTFEHAEYLPRVVVSDRTQPEFISTFFTYTQKRVTRGRVAAGRQNDKSMRHCLIRLRRNMAYQKVLLLPFGGWKRIMVPIKAMWVCHHH